MVHAGRSIPSTTMIDGNLAIRPCFVGARTSWQQADNLLEDMNAPERLKHLVRSAVVEEDFWGDYLAWRFGPFGLKTVFIPQIREEMWKILELSAQETSLEKWLNLVLHRVINFVYGSEVFPSHDQ